MSMVYTRALLLFGLAILSKNATAGSVPCEIEISRRSLTIKIANEPAEIFLRDPVATGIAGVVSWNRKPLLRYRFTQDREVYRWEAQSIANFGQYWVQDFEPQRLQGSLAVSLNYELETELEQKLHEELTEFGNAWDASPSFLHSVDRVTLEEFQGAAHPAHDFFGRNSMWLPWSSHSEDEFFQEPKLREAFAKVFLNVTGRTYQDPIAKVDFGVAVFTNVEMSSGSQPTQDVLVIEIFNTETEYSFSIAFRRPRK